MSVDFYLLPRAQVPLDAESARAWLDSEERRFPQIPLALDAATESRKRKLADLLLQMKPEFTEFRIRHEELARFDKITTEEAARKYRYIEINGSGVQFSFYDRHSALSVYSNIDAEELDAILAALSEEGDFVLFDPQSNIVMDLKGESFV